MSKLDEMMKFKVVDTWKLKNTMWLCFIFIRKTCKVLRVVAPAAAVPEVNGCIIIDSDEEEARYQTGNVHCIEMNVCYGCLHKFTSSLRKNMK